MEALMIGLGGAKYLGDVAANENSKKVAAATAKWSPWTGQAIPKVSKANFAADMIPATLMAASAGKWFDSAPSMGEAGSAPIRYGSDAPEMIGWGPSAPGSTNGWGSVVDKSLSPWDMTKAGGGIY